MAKVKQLTVALENRPGTLAHMAKVLADAKANVLALLGSTAVAQGSVQVVVDNVNKAKKALGGAGLSYTEGTLEQFELRKQARRTGGIGREAGEEGHQHRFRLRHDAQRGEEGGSGACALRTYPYKKEPAGA
jgi:hypothetical protein